eukprot:SAG11_NODE_1176_length_5600_cov_8.953827_5_plen_87_part_00
MKMNILDLNYDIMSKIKHNLFLKSLMKRTKDNFEFVFYDWDCWGLERDLSGFYFDSRKLFTDVINNFNYSFIDVRGNCVLHRCIKA